MAITSIHAITQTVGNAISYCMADKQETLYGTKDDVQDALKYAIKDKEMIFDDSEHGHSVIYPTLTVTLNCPSGDASKDFAKLIDTYNGHNSYRNYISKGKKNPLAWHLIQSFEGRINPILASDIGCELARELFSSKFRVQVSTHTNTENTHNHILICAWDIDGRKHNQTNGFYQRIRETSDRLCEKYGLPVLEATRKQRLVRWYDSNGKMHYYEPTARKNKLIDERARQKKVTDEVGSYRHYDGYGKKQKETLRNRQIICADIDKYAAQATDFENFIFLLRSRANYKIRCKKKNGEWLKYISYQPPMAEAPIRDYMLDDRNGAYSRKSLEKKIERYQSERCKGSYADTDLDMLEKTARGGLEIEALRKIKDLQQQLHEELMKSGFVSKELDDIIKRQQETGKISGRSVSRNERLRINSTVKSIQRTFDAMHTLDRRSLYERQELDDAIAASRGKEGNYRESLNRVRQDIKNIKELLNMPNKLRQTQDRLISNAGNKDYLMYDFETDNADLKRYHKMIEKYHVDSAEKSAALRAEAARLEQQEKALVAALESATEETETCESCRRVILEENREGLPEPAIEDRPLRNNPVHSMSHDER